MTDPRVALRPATTADDAFLCRVYRCTREAELALTGWDEAEKHAFVRMQLEAQRRHHQAYDGHSSHVMEVGGQAVGRLEVARGPGEIRVLDITLLADHRNRGVGSVLLRGLLAEGEASDRAVTVHVEPLNPARRLYERLGFQLEADRGLHLLLRWLPSGLRR